LISSGSCPPESKHSTPSTLTTHSAPSNLTPPTSTGPAGGGSKFDLVLALLSPCIYTHHPVNSHHPLRPVKSHTPNFDRPRRRPVDILSRLALLPPCI
jgi:hypothetical protein